MAGVNQDDIKTEIDRIKSKAVKLPTRNAEENNIFAKCRNFTQNSNNIFSKFKQNADSHKWEDCGISFTEQEWGFLGEEHVKYFQRPRRVESDGGNSFRKLKCSECGMQAIVFKHSNLFTSLKDSYSIFHIYNNPGVFNNIKRLPLETDASETIELSCNYFKLKAAKIGPMEAALKSMKEQETKLDEEFKSKKEIASKIDVQLLSLEKNNNTTTTTKYGFAAGIQEMSSQLSRKKTLIASVMSNLESKRTELHNKIISLEAEIKDATSIFDTFYATNSLLEKDPETAEGWTSAQNQWKDEMYRIVSEVEVNANLEDPLEEEFRLLEAQMKA